MNPEEEENITLRKALLKQLRNAKIKNKDELIDMYKEGDVSAAYLVQVLAAYKLAKKDRARRKKEAEEREREMKKKQKETITLTAEQREKLKTIYYEEKNYVGRDKLVRLLKERGEPITRSLVQQWLNEQEVSQLHRKPQRTSTVQPIYVPRPNEFFQMDLMDLGTGQTDAQQPNRYILNIIDAFSRKMYVSVLQKKDAPTVLRATKKILEKLPKVRVIMSDNGGEFVADEMKEYLKERGIRHVTGIAGRPQGQGIVERSNGTIKDLIEKNKTVKGNNTWVKDLPQLVEVYNNTYHDTIGMAPNQVTEENAKEVAEKLFAKLKRRQAPTTAKELQVGDRVRLKINKGKLDKYSTVNWSASIYRVVRVFRSSKPYIQTSYRIANSEGTTLKNVYVYNDLQKIDKVSRYEKPKPAEREEGEEKVEGEKEQEANVKDKKIKQEAPEPRRSVRAKVRSVLLKDHVTK